MKKTLLATALVAASATAMADVQLSGQVSQAVVFGGDVEDPTVVDNNTSGSRFRIKASQGFADGWKIGTRYEMQAQDNSSSSLSDGTISEVRYSDIYVSGPVGKIAVGKGEGAADGTFESYGMLFYYGGAGSRLLVQNDGLYEAGAAGTDYRDIDGTSRENRVRYDSPKFAGFSAAYSLDNGDKDEIAVKYDGKFGFGKVRARAGVVDGETEELTSASIAAKFGFGLGLSYSWGENDLSDVESEWVQASYSFGKYLVSYGFGESGTDGDNELAVLSFVYKPAKGTEIYLQSYDWDNGNGTDGSALALGGRIKF